MFKTYFIDVVKNHYVDFAGCATRKQFWLFTLFNLIITLVLYFLVVFMDNVIGTLASVLYTLYSLALLLPSLAIAARRLHDIGRSAWWLLLLFVPFIGPIVLLVFYLLPSKQ